MKVKSQESRVESRKRGIALRSYSGSPLSALRSPLFPRSGSRLLTLDPRLPHRGMTLIELLVVIIIVTTIVAAAIPIMTPADDARSLREASRALNTIITTAQARAVQANRPYGIGLKRLSQDTGRVEDRAVCVQAFFVEQQPAFCGFSDTSMVRVTRNPASNGGYAVQFLRRDPSGYVSDLTPNVIRRGDVIEVNGFLFALTDSDVDALGYYRQDSGDPDGELWVKPLNDTGNLANLNFVDRDPITTRTIFWTLPARYKIHRQPVTTSDEPFQMPEGTAIDLRASGVGYNDYFYWPTIHDNDDPVIVMFNPEGKVAKLRYNQKYQPNPNVFVQDIIFDAPVVDDLFLLVGKRGNIPAPDHMADPTLTGGFSSLDTEAKRSRVRDPINWLNGSSRWVLIGSQTGRVTTFANTFVDPEAVLNTYGSPQTEQLRAQQIIAARELTRSTTRAGGR